MIKQGEIQKIAATLGLRDTQIEKDYVIGWVLYGLTNYEGLKNVLVFKGGTSLRKIYFEDYRLSEDLDFTFIGKKFDKDEIKAHFENIVKWIAEESRINLSIEDETLHATGNYNFYLSYIGPLGGKGENKKIKIDICSDESLCDDPGEKTVLNDYSDLDDYSILTYTLGEIISEKLRSLMQRSEPRDLYDIWYLLVVASENIEDHIFNFYSKAEAKEIDPTKLKDVVEKKEEIFKKHWNSRLTNQINELPEFDEVWRDLSKQWRIIEKINK